jgi:hypothetical protein
MFYSMNHSESFFLTHSILEMIISKKKLAKIM